MLGGPARHDGRLVGRLRGGARRAAGAVRTPRRARFTWAPRRSQRADRWFQRYGEPGRAVRSPDPARPRVRLAACRRRADAARRFTLLHADRRASRGCSGWRSPGDAVGGDWKSVRKGFEYVDYVLLALIVSGDRLRDRAPPAGTPAPRHRCGGLSGRCRLRHAVALGLLQGPTELLPVSSSAHTTLVPWLPAGATRARRRAAQVLRGRAARAARRRRWRSTCAGADRATRAARRAAASLLVLALAPAGARGPGARRRRSSAVSAARARSRWRSRRGRPGCCRRAARPLAERAHGPGRGPADAARWTGSRSASRRPSR